jgi:hypothetical protein
MHLSKPVRVSHTYRQSLRAPPVRVFPLLCPVREVEWAVGWAPLNVVSDSGVAEPDCVFVTPATPHDAIWYITRHEPDRLLVEFLKITPAVTACRIVIQLSGNERACVADVTYTHTSLGPLGDDFVASFTAEHYRQFMQDWERELNNCLLAHGRGPLTP